MSILKQPLISIGVPTYNRPVELSRVLNQLTHQTYKNIEIIIVDNCSDLIEVESVSRSFCSKYKNIRYYKNEENIGVLKNSVKALSYATGEYFCWVADDDFRNDDFIERLVEKLNADHETSCVFCNFIVVDETQKECNDYPTNFSTLMWFVKLKSKLLRRLIYYFSSSGWGKCNLFYSLYRTKTIKEINFKALSNNFTSLDMDSLVIFELLKHTKFTILDYYGCKFTIGNYKYYTNNEIRYGFGKFKAYILTSYSEYRRYCEQADRMEAILITFIFPLKVAKGILSYFFKIKTLNPFAKYNY